MAQIEGPLNIGRKSYNQITIAMPDSKEPMIRVQFALFLPKSTQCFGRVLWHTRGLYEGENYQGIAYNKTVKSPDITKGLRFPKTLILAVSTPSLDTAS